MRVADVGVSVVGDRSRISAAVESPRWSTPRDVWFEMPSQYLPAEPALSGDAWLAALLLPAMRIREPLSIDACVSVELERALPQLQAIYAAWNPSARPVDVEHAGRRDARVRNAHVGLFFSCGVDSWFSLLQSEERRLVGRRPDVTHLVNVHGVDIDVGEWKADVAGAMAENTAAIAEHYGLASLVVSTNVRRLYTAMGISWTWGQAGALAAITLLMEDSFARMLVASDDRTLANHAVDPSGCAGSCNPLHLPLFSTASCDIGLHGAGTTRLEKVARVAEAELAMTTLRVCWANHDPAYNCGCCAKCVDTTIDLGLAGAAGRCATLPTEIAPDVIAATRSLFPDQPLWEHRYDVLRAREAGADILHATRTLIEAATEHFAERARALATIREIVDPDEVVVLFDEDEIRFELATTHAWALPFTEHDGVFNGAPIDSVAAIAELERLRARGARKFAVWKSTFWALDHYVEFATHLQTTCASLATTPEVLVFDVTASPS